MSDRPTVGARLSKDGRYVLCGAINCGTRIAERRCGKGGGVQILGTAGGRSPRRSDALTPFGGKTTHNRCNVVSFAGWQENRDGIWEMTAGSRRRYEADRRRARGDLKISPSEVARAQERLRTNRSTRFAHASSDNQPPSETEPRQVQHRILPPARIRCPKCSMINRLESDLLANDTAAR